MGVARVGRQGLGAPWLTLAGSARRCSGAPPPGAPWLRRRTVGAIGRDVVAGVRSGPPSTHALLPARGGCCRDIITGYRRLPDGSWRCADTVGTAGPILRPVAAQVADPASEDVGCPVAKVRAGGGAPAAQGPEWPPVPKGRRIEHAKGGTRTRPVGAERGLFDDRGVVHPAREPDPACRCGVKTDPAASGPVWPPVPKGGDA